MTSFANEQVQIWRCTKCGKWSHAKRQPKKHLRTVFEGEPEYDPSLGQAAWGPTYPEGDYGPDCHGIECGPFAPFVATPGRLR